jgi:nucleotide-binding universal stress UspA family protein
MKILVAIDDSAGSRAVVKEVAQRPWPTGSTVIVFSVYEMSLGPMADPWLVPHDEERIRQAARKQAQDLVETAAGKIDARTKSELKITTKIMEGRPARAILDQAERAKIDLILVGSHGHTGWERLILGSIAHAVALHAPCSVEIVRQRKKHSKS